MVETHQKATVVCDPTRKGSTLDIAASEIETYWRGCGIVEFQFTDSKKISDEGYSITRIDDDYVISARSEIGMLYGAYGLLRMQATNYRISNNHTFFSSPYYTHRILNHWDNINGTIERGFAGRSIFFPLSTNGSTPHIRPFNSTSTPLQLPFNSSSITDYARANASIGINGAVINNVNASPKILADANLFKIVDIANALRPYGIRLYLSINFASPLTVPSADTGKTLSTADPLDPAVQQWWAEKIDHIYKLIPDFGGFLVKANSEGQPGPMDFGRTHADGANMLADALAPYGGIVMWRAFVYAQNSPDRASQAYDEFVPLDGQFRDNVILQVKNGPVDFQPREPVSPLFFNIEKTNLMPEFQITQEYTGENIHTCFLAPMWKEFFEGLNSSSGSKGLNSSSGSRGSIAAIAGVANIGNDIDWCGGDMAQANWYAFGRLAWNPELSSEKIADEWLSQTYTKAREFVDTMTTLLCNSREAVVNYMMPLGLHHIFAGGHHYGPEPWYSPKNTRADWTPPYYHRADSVGLGFDRTTEGSGNVLQYPDSLCHLYNNKDTCPRELLLWFHHMPWSEIWTPLCRQYDIGVNQAEGFVETWQRMQKYVDTERYERQLSKFQRQASDAWWWRDACLLYFQQFSHMPLPDGSPAPRHTLQELMDFHLDMDMYTSAEKFKTP